MIIIYSKNKIPIRLTGERWDHIIYRHPELKDEREKVIETLEKPEFIKRGDFGTLIAVKFYSETPLTSKYLIVVYKELNRHNGFLITAYFTSKLLRRREILWKQ